MSRISWTDSAGVLQVLEPDATLSEQHAAEAEVTEDPVEQGANTTDNVRAKSQTLALEVFFADQYKGSTYKTSGGATFDFELGRCERALSTFERLQREGQRVTVELGGKFGFGRRYENMVIQSARAVRTSKERDSLTISLSLKQIRIVRSETVAAQVAKEAKCQPKVTKGDQGTKPVDPPDRYESNLFRIFVK